MSSLWWQSKEAVDDVRDFIISQSLLVYAHDGSPTNLSVTLTPTPFPVSLFQHALKIQSSLNEIIHSLSCDCDFITRTLERIAKTDDFVRRLMEIYQEVLSTGDKQTTCLGLYRTDYLVDAKTSHDGHVTIGLKMVEMNTIASSFGGHSPKIPGVHKYVCDRYTPNDHYEADFNGCLDGLADGLATAWKEYGKSSAVILFVVIEGDSNIFDQRQLEYNLWKRYTIRVMRRTLTEIGRDIRLTSEREAFIGDREIAVAYYRAGYDPSSYPSDLEWSGRRLLELSQASNCPSVGYQLVGFKKIQQAISERGVLEKYCVDEAIASAVRQTFTGQYTMEHNPEGDKAVAMALRDPHLFVMKPQREGGGNNFYNEELKENLSRIASSEERERYILMEFINAPSFPNLIFKKGDTAITQTRVINELGVYGVYVRKNDKVLMNTTPGRLLRSKPLGFNEGGVAIGIAALDEPHLISNDEYCKILNDV